MSTNGVDFRRAPDHSALSDGDRYALSTRRRSVKPEPGYL